MSTPSQTKKLLTFLEEKSNLTFVEFYPLYKLCDPRSRFPLFQTIQTNDKLSLLEGFNENEWTQILEGCPQSDRGNLLCLVMTYLPHATLTLKHTKYISAPSYDRIVLLMIRFLNKQNLFKEAKRLSKERNNIPLLNPSNIQICEEANQEDDQCTICLTNKRNVVNIGCGHATLCIKCVDGFHQDTCPICQKPLTTWLVIV